MTPPYTQAGSLAREEMGRRLRASRRRLTDSEAEIVEGSGKSERRTRLADSVRAWKVWAACAELTASYCKGSDQTHVRTIANVAGIRADKASPILRLFDVEGIFGWRKEEGKRASGLLSLPSLGEPDAASSPKAARGKPTCPNCGSTDIWSAHPEDSRNAALAGCNFCDHTWEPSTSAPA